MQDIRIKDPTPKTFGKIYHAHVFETSTEFAEKFLARHSYGSAAEAARTLLTGDESMVEASNAYLTKLEDMITVETKKFRIIDDVSGGLPNVPALLAGHPLAMRRRQRVASDQGAITILLDLTTSQGISTQQIERRGAALLALVRILSSLRPVNLYAMTALGCVGHHRNVCACTLVHVETAPLDLARAAYLLSARNVSRELFFRYGDTFMEVTEGDITWPWNNRDLGHRELPAIIGQHIAGEIAFIPGMHVDDVNKDRPEKWLREQLHRYGGELFNKEKAQ